MRLFIRILSGSELADLGANQTAGKTIQCQWLVRDDRGQTLAQGETDAAGLSDIANVSGVGSGKPSGEPSGEPSGDPDILVDPDDLVVLVPSAQVAWLSRTVPGRRAAQIRRALPFAVEEDLTQDVESMHLAHAPIVRGQPVRCALIDRHLLADWLACLRDRGLRPGHMVPDACLLPCSQSSASVLFEGAEAVVRTPEHIATVEASILPDILESVRASFDNADESLELDLIGGEAIDERMDDSGFNVRRTALRGTVLEFLASRWDADRPEINLLQGPFAPSKGAGTSRGGWRGVAGLAALWLIVTLAVLIAEGYVANHRADALEAELTALYRSIYPNERRIPNAYAQMRAKLRESDAGHAVFHTLLGQLAAGTTQGNTDVSVRSITFNDSRGELTSELWLPGYARLDALKLELERRGLAVDISSAEERDNVVRARLRIRMSG